MLTCLPLASLERARKKELVRLVYNPESAELQTQNPWELESVKQSRPGVVSESDSDS